MGSAIPNTNANADRGQASRLAMDGNRRIGSDDTLTGGSRNLGDAVGTALTDDVTIPERKSSIGTGLWPTPNQLATALN